MKLSFGFCLICMVLVSAGFGIFFYHEHTNPLAPVVTPIQPDTPDTLRYAQPGEYGISEPYIRAWEGRYGR
jgi:hypothetical protein